MLARFQLALAAAWLAFATAPGWATPVKTPHVEAQLVAEQSAFEPGKPFTVGLRILHAPHWHTYWRNPGDSGLATKITWTLPPGFSAGPIQWPYPRPLPLGPLMNFGYEGELLLLTEITPPASARPGETSLLKARGDWLVCKDICIPESGEFSLAVAAGTPKPGAWQPLFKASRFELPAALPDWRLSTRIAGNEGTITLVPPAGFAGRLEKVGFFPYRDDLMENASAQVLTREGGGYVLKVKLLDTRPKDVTELAGVLVAPGGWGKPATKAALLGVDPGQSGALPAAFASTTAAPPTSAASPLAGKPLPTSDLGLGLALVFAFIGGLILNLMPCVFPVLGIKVLSFVRNAHEDARLLRLQGLLFLAGVVLSFWVLAGLLLALQAGGLALGWGFQLQSPGFITFLAMLFTLLALNLLGVFEWGSSLQAAAGSAQARGLRSEALLAGVLATVVATPCTAPFMGSALGFTLSQPAAVAFLVFTALALGMAAPVTVLAFYPKALKWLPRPGPWMETFKQLMAFPLFATVIWLAWVLGAQLGNDGVLNLLAGLLLLSMAAWAYGRWSPSAAKLATGAAAGLAALGVVLAWPGEAPPAPLAAHAAPAKPGELAWQAWSPDTLAGLRAQGKPVFVDFTAAWCITCQVNKRLALHQPDVVAAFAEKGIVPLKADWTRQDPVITQALAGFGRNAVPLYVLYPGVGDPIVLPEVLTQTLVLAEVQKLAQPKQSATR